MHSQSQQNSASAESSQAPQAGHFSHENRPPFVAGYQQGQVNNRDGNGFMPLLGGLNLQNQRPGSKFGPLKGNLPMPMAPGVDLSNTIRNPYNGQLMFLPNAMLGGIPAMGPFAPAPVSGHEQMGQLPYFPANLYPGINPNVSMVPGAIQPYQLPYVMNSDAQDQKRNSWPLGEDHKGNPASVVSESGNQTEYTNSTVSHLDASTVSGFGYNVPSQLGQPILPFQMMKTPTGYMLQDLEALTQQEPAIPRAVPAMWTNPSELTLAKCLENREGITNVYIRGFLPETTDDMLHAYAARFGKIDRCKAIVDLDTGLCKGFGFVQYFNFESCENCIRGFFYLGYQASFAQKSRNSRLKDLEDRASTNIYCTNIPIEWTEADLRRHFEPYQVISEKISRDDKTGVSKEVGFARFESREIAEKVLNEFHNAAAEDGVKLLLRFADTKAQKMLKHQSNERRAYRAGEYNYSVEVIQGSTPSPSIHRLHQTASHLSPASQVSYPSPLGVGSTWTPATSISPSSYPLMKNQAGNARLNSWSSRKSPSASETPVYRGKLNLANRNDNVSTGSSKTMIPTTPCTLTRPHTASPRKENMKTGSLSPISSRREIIANSPRSCT